MQVVLKSWIIIRRVLKILWLTIVGIAATAIAGILLLQVPAVQTYVAGKAVKALSGKLDADIVFEKIHLKPFTTLVIKDIAIIDRNPAIDREDSTSAQVDTFFRAGYIIARFTLDGLTHKPGIHIGKAYIADAQMNLVLEDKADTGDGDIKTDNLSRIFRLKKRKGPKPRNDKELFHIKKVEIHNMGFLMRNYQTGRNIYEGDGIDWNDLDVKEISINARELRFKGGIMSGIADRLSFTEKSGYRTHFMSGKATVGRGRTIVEELTVLDPWSDVDVPLFMMSYDSVRDFSDFISKVKIDGDIAASRLDFRTLSYFAPALKGNTLNATVSGKVSGYVDRFTLDNIYVSSSAGGFSGTVSGSIKGLPDIDETGIDATLKGFSITSGGLSSFISQWMKDGRLDLGKYAEGITFSLDGKASGPLNNLKVDAEIDSKNAGGLDADVTLDDILTASRPTGISGSIRTRDLDISRFIDISFIRQASLKARFSAQFGGGSPASLQIDTLGISRLNILDYDYSGIKGRGNLSGNSFNGRMICHDPNLNFIFDGAFALSAKTNNARYNFRATIGEADLNALNIDRRGKSKIALNTNVNFTRTAKGDIFGDVHIGDAILENRDGRYNIGDFVLTSHSKDEKYTMMLNSSFADGLFEGSGSLMDFIRDLRLVTFHRELPAQFTTVPGEWSGNRYDIIFKCHNTKDILSFAVPGMYIEDGTYIKGGITRDGTASLNIDSGRLAFKGQYLKGLSGAFSNADGQLSGYLKSEEAEVATFLMKNNIINLNADDNHIALEIGYDNHSTLENRGRLMVDGDLNRADGILGLDVDVKPTSVFINSKRWDILPAGMSIRGKDIGIDSFGITSGREAIRVYGGTSAEQQDTLTLALDRFDISILNPILGKELGIKGEATGKVMLTSPLESKGILADMTVASTYIAEEPLGTLYLGSSWDAANETFNIMARNSMDGRSTLDAGATFRPSDKYIDAAARLDALNVAYAQPFLTDIFSVMKGRISGELMAEGPLKHIEISSRDTRLEDAELTVAYTNVPYGAEGAFHLDNKGVYFDDIHIRDRYNGTGRITGAINYDLFRDFMFDTHINVEQIEAINIDEKNNDGFYGNIFGTGKVSITGPVSSLLMDIDAVTAKRGQLHIPMGSSSSTVKGNSVLTFKEMESQEVVDPYEMFVRQTKKRESTGGEFTVKMRVNAQPDVEAFVEIDKASGNVLSGQGNGIIELEAGPDVFNINGDYNITSGNYKFVAMGLIGRDFQIQDGSSIRFNGDIMESTLNIDAVYRTKASLSTLISDTTSVSNRRTVDCGINISGRLSNPQLDFSIDIPDLDPTIKSRVESALSTKDKVQRQFLSLILSNSFLPDEQSGIVNNTTLLYSNVMEMMNNQLNNIFEKLGIPMEMGLNYQPSEKGNDMFDVAISTQLFNNRVVVNGSVGNKQYGSNTQNEVAGDLDIEIKLNRSGSFRLNIFSHSADSYTNYLDNSQRSGAGLTYQAEFNNFWKFVKNIFSRKAKRQEARQKEEEEMLNVEKRTLKIEAPKASDKDNDNGKDN